MPEEIIVEVDFEGNVEVRTQGMKGKKCLQASKFIEEALGTTTGIRKTADFYADEIPEKVRVSNNGK